MPTQIPVSLPKLRGSRADGVTSREVGGDGEVVEIELKLVVFGCRGRSTIGCLRMGGGEGGKVVDCSCRREYMERSTHKFRAGTDLAESGEGAEADAKGSAAEEGAAEDVTGRAEPEPA